MKNNAVDNVNDFILYSIISTIDSKQLSKYFTKIEISSYKKEKYDDSISIPREFEVVKIRDDQWLGRIKVTDWMKLRDLQIINYNENTQRPLKKVVRGEIETYKIDINKTQVEDIYNSIMEDTYIPDTITLNLPEDAVYEYDEDTSILNILHYDHFDITDGMHRYLAFSRAYEAGKDFSDYYEELRITCFNETKADDFIWQQDQKYKMTKVTAKSFNQNAMGSIITKRLNESSVLKNQINKSDGVINSITLSTVITVLFDIKAKKSIEAQVARKKYEIELNRAFSKKLESLIEANPDLMIEKWSDEFIVAFATAVKLEVEDDKLLDFCTELSKNKLRTLNSTSIKKYLAIGGEIYV